MDDVSAASLVFCRAGQKFVHVALHSCAVLCMVLALAAVLQSHRLKRPVCTSSCVHVHVHACVRPVHMYILIQVHYGAQDPFLNFYSPHSWLGLGTFTLVIVQV